MFFEVGNVHHRPHIHAYHGEHVAVYAIDKIDLIAGGLPKKEQRLVEAWVEIYQEALLADWTLLQQGKTPRPIPPLS